MKAPWRNRRNMLEEFKILTLVCQKLDQAHIPYTLTGSLAANFYAAPRMTRDIDIVLEILENDISNYQMRDVKNLLSSGITIDNEYLNNWIQSLGLHNVFEKANSHG
jgi:hypothetical protein